MEHWSRAPVEKDGWDIALNELAQATGCSRAQLVGIGPHAATFNRMTNISDAYFEEFMAIEAYRPDVNFRVAASKGVFDIVAEDDYARIRSQARCDVYEEHAARWEGGGGCQTVLVEEAEHFVGLAVLRDERDGPTTAAQRDVFAFGALLAAQAVRLDDALSGQVDRLAAERLDSVEPAALLIDAAGAPVQISPAAEDLLRHPAISGVRVERGRLTFTNPSADAAFEAALAAARRRGKLPGLLASFWSKPHRLGAPLAAAARCEVHALGSVRAAQGRGRLLVVIRSPRDQARMTTRLLAAQLGLTAAESAVAAGLADGLSRDELAIRRGVSVHTLNAQIKAIAAKLGVTRETEIVAIVRAFFG